MWFFYFFFSTLYQNLNCKLEFNEVIEGLDMLNWTGFKESKTACCGQGPYNGFGLCTVFSNICDNRDDYVFWDPFHPSERANRLIVEQIFNGSRTHMYPKNLNTIMALDSRVWSWQTQISDMFGNLELRYMDWNLRRSIFFFFNSIPES